MSSPVGGLRRGTQRSALAGFILGSGEVPARDPQVSSWRHFAHLLRVFLDDPSSSAGANVFALAMV